MWNNANAVFNEKEGHGYPLDDNLLTCHTNNCMIYWIDKRLSCPQFS